MLTLTHSDNTLFKCVIGKHGLSDRGLWVSEASTTSSLSANLSSTKCFISFNRPTMYEESGFPYYDRQKIYEYRMCVTWGLLTLASKGTGRLIDNWLRLRVGLEVSPKFGKLTKFNVDRLHDSVVIRKIGQTKLDGRYPEQSGSFGKIQTPSSNRRFIWSSCPLSMTTGSYKPSV